ncbi:MAG: PDZ domain-containing protein, partial [Bryobacterales bacterium]
MRSLILPVIVVGLAASSGAKGQPLPPVPPAPPPPLVASAQAAPAPPPVPLTPQIPAAAPAPRVAPAPPVPPPPPTPPFIARLVQAPGLLFAPQASQSYLGVHLIEVSDERARELGMKEPYGVEIMSVASGSPAGDAGLRKRDVIIRYSGQRVEGQEQLVRLVRETPVGREVEVGVFRNGSEINLNIEVGELKVPAPKVLFNCGAEP